MRRSIATVSLSGSLREKLEAAAAARFDAVEIFENDLLTFDGSPSHVRMMAADLGLEIALYQPFRDFDTSRADVFERNLERARRKFDVMDALGAKLILICSNVQPTAAEPELAAAQLHTLAEIAATRGIRLGYEALAWGTQINTFEQAWSIVQKADHPHLGLVLDSFHTLAKGLDGSALAQIPGEKIFFLQLADAPLLKMDLLSWSRHFRCFPGQGELDVATFTAKAIQAGYTGPLSLEVFNDDFRASPTRPTAIDGMRSLLALEEQVRGQLVQGREPAASPDTSQPNTRRTVRTRPPVELFDPPPAPALDGVAFIEFAVDAETSQALEAYLQRLGFALAGQHRSKDVSLLRQGSISLILNRESKGFAHAYFALHGPGVCALALASDDPQASVARAVALKCARIDGSVQHAETVLPSIRAQDAHLLYFTDARLSGGQAFQADFNLSGQSDYAGCGLDGIDHVAHALPDGQLDSWVLFLRATLGMRAEKAVDLADPYGLVQSRAMASVPDLGGHLRRVRFPLNISQKHNTSTARSVSAFAGAGVHHVAFQSADIFKSLTGLRERGAGLLPIPDNYYEDLPAKFDLPLSFVDQLQSGGILYDQDEHGAFLQIFTTPFEDRFFFEIVERRGSYEGYGAANAPVRMAAQSQWHERQLPAGLPKLPTGRGSNMSKS